MTIFDYIGIIVVIVLIVWLLLRRYNVSPLPTALVCRGNSELFHRARGTDGYNFYADHPAVIFHVVGQSRDDALMVVQAGSHHPGSQRIIRRVIIRRVFAYSAAL